MESENIGAQIKRQRKKEKLTQMELSLSLGKKTNTVGQWEKGHKNPTINDLYEMNSLYNFEFNIKN